jgi:hypothetical protein
VETVLGPTRPQHDGWVCMDLRANNLDSLVAAATPLQSVRFSVCECVIMHHVQGVGAVNSRQGMVGVGG